MFLDRSSPRRLGIALAILLGLVWVYRLGLPVHSFKVPDVLKEGGLFHKTNEERSFNLTNITSDINLSETFTYAHRTIKTKHFYGERPDLTTMDEKLFPHTSSMLLSKHQPLDEVWPLYIPPLTLHVPSSPMVDTSIFAFGIATPIPRLLDSLDQLAHWLPGSGSSLSVISPSESASTPYMRHQVEATAISLNLALNITPSDVPFPIAYFSLIKVLYEARSAHTEWIVLIDDDTFIPSLPTLAAHLKKHYDHDEEQMVAAITDDKHQIDVWGLIPFGGGGVFISVPLAARLIDPEIWNICVEGMGQAQGDGILGRCLNMYTDIRPKFDLKLNQMDIRGDAAGLFESGRRMLTIHHWRSWFHVDVARAGVVAKSCGFEGVLQRWAFPEENIVLTNGFSIVQYPAGLGDIDLVAVEKTWGGEAERFLHHIGPLREPTDENQKIPYRLVRADVVDGGVRQLYHRPRVEGREGDRGMDALLELFWLS